MNLRISPVIAARGLHRWLLLLVVVAAMIAAAGREQVLTPTIELGDFAANSLLVQDAKAAALLAGNYSRVGFNHPGPAILYVLAAGEAIFHDWLAIVPSPFAGQRIGAAVYNACWITLLAVLFQRIVPQGRVVALATATFVLVSALFEHQFLTGMWFPHLYYFPFAVALLAMARLAGGRGDSLGILALSSGFLLNGHVAFAPILGVMLVCLIAYNLLACRAEPARVLVRPAFLHAHGRDLLRAATILAVFLVPLAVLTVREFPGPLAAYAAFGAGRQANGLEEALGFTGVYWGGTAGLALGMVGCGVLLLPKAAVLAPRLPLRDAAAAILAATAAVAFYAMFGVDQLDHPYIALFHHAAPALLVALLCAAAAEMARQRAWRVVSLFATGLMTAASFAMATRTTNDVDPPDRQQSVRALVDALQARKGTGRIVLDLDASNDWPWVWSTVVGAQNLAKRGGLDLFCVAAEWHILFTKAARCAPGEYRGEPQFLVSRAVSQPLPGEVFRGAGLSFRQVAAPDIAGGGVLEVRSHADAFRRKILVRGWSEVEATSVWTNGPEAALSLALPAGRPGVLRLDLVAYVPRQMDRQVVEVVAGGQVLAAVEFSWHRRSERVIVPIADGAQAADLRLRIRHPVSPREAAAGSDARRLGVALRRIQFDPL